MRKACMINKPKNPGFTIVELLIVIVVIAILAAISITAYTGIQTRTHNSLRAAEAKEWVKLLSLYASLEHDYPVSDRYCLGRGFPKYNGSTVGNCWDANDFYRADENESIMSDIEQVTGSSLPKYNRLIISEDGIDRVGPIFWGNRRDNEFYVKYFLRSSGNTAATDPCPIGDKLWSGTYTYSCNITLPPPN